MIRTHAALPQVFAFFWVPLSFLGVASVSKLCHRAMAETTLELRWLHDLLCDMGVSVVAHVPMHCDNKSAIVIASKSVFHDRTKHIEINCHITR